jgi:hypothetical protein
MIAFRIAEGFLGKNFAGQDDFFPDKPFDEWICYRAINSDKNSAKVLPEPLQASIIDFTSSSCAIKYP